MLTLCRVTTEDGLQLDGAFASSSQKHAPALLLIHGTGSNFYGSGILSSLADHAHADGHPVLRINTRGHDLMASIPGPTGSIKGGAAFEQVLDCHRDLTAWCDFLVSQGCRSIVLIGHSLGGVKAFWSQKLAPHSNVAGIVGVSPPRFCHRKFQADERCEPFRRDFAAALRHIAEGCPETPMTVTQPLPLVITARGFFEKYGPDDPLDYLPILSELDLPKLIVLGGDSVEHNPAFGGLPDDLAPLVADNPLLSAELISGADINYRHDPAEPWRRIREWLKRIPVNE